MYTHTEQEDAHIGIYQSKLRNQFWILKTQMNDWINKKVVTYIQWSVKSLKKEGNFDTCCNMDES